MSEEERKALLERIKASTEEAKKMTREEARQRLQSEGFYDENGHLTEPFGGQAAALRG